MFISFSVKVVDMKKLMFLTLILVLLPMVLADSCDTFCASEGFDYGTCRAVSEETICSDNEEAYGFDYCVDFERCCCGSEEVVVVEEVTEEEVVNETVYIGEEESLEVTNVTERVTLWDYLVDVYYTYFVYQETGGNETLEDTGEEVVDLNEEEEEVVEVTKEEVVEEITDDVVDEEVVNETVDVNESVEVVEESKTNFWDFMTALVTDEYEECGECEDCVECEECVQCEECTELNSETCADYVDCPECDSCTEEVEEQEANIAKVLATFLLCLIVVLLIARLFKSSDEEDDFEFD